MTSLSTRSEQDFLLHLKAQESFGDTELERETAAIILANCQDQPSAWLNNVLKQGYWSGLVPELDYYSHTDDFFDRHYEAIDQLRADFEDKAGAPLQIQGDMKNFFAWFSFERMAKKFIQDHQASYIA